MKNKFLTDLNDPDRGLFYAKVASPEGEVHEEMRLISMGEGPRKQFLFTDSLMYPNKGGDVNIFHHEHHKGYETFFVDSGGLDYYINGKKTYVGPGNILHMQPYESHGMFFHAHTKYRGVFHDWDSLEDAMVLRELDTYYPDIRKSPEFTKAVRKTDTHLREPVNCVEVPVGEVPAVRNPDRPLAEFRFDGLTLKMLVGRWENGGLCETWRAEMKKGFHAEWVDFTTMTELYYVTEGEIKFEVYTEEFVAGPECVVRIPMYAPHSITAVSDAAMYDLGGNTRWFALIQDWLSIQKYFPERAAKPETFEELKAKYDCQIKSFGLC
jgi:mannose-6-phosphate isomerase-like protein (cupin superfamily)